MYYTNNSPQALTYIYMNLMPNAYRGKRSALNNQLLAYDEQSLQFAGKSYKGYIDSLKWRVNDSLVETQLCRDTFDIEILPLPEPLLPGQSVRIETPFYVKLPSTHISRMGFKNTAYYVTQWYPKPAVYDQYGWHPYSYLDNGEFYSEFGNYEVHITVPQNFVVAATGNLITPREIKNLDTLAQFSASYIHPKKRRFLKKSIIPSPKKKTLVYRINNVHDFAFCADPEFLLLRDSISIDNKTVTVQSFVKFSHKENWKDNNEYLKQALLYYSKELGPYPYDHFSLVDVDDITGGDMEYPTLAWINNDYSMEEVITHETGHNWFYGVLGTNERDEHWMDEGLNSFYEQLYFYEKYPDEKIHFYPEFLDANTIPFYQQSHYEYYSLARMNEDMPVKTKAHLLSEENYQVLAYSKPAANLWYLYNQLGADTFKLVMQEYYSTWQFKHPMSNDLHDVFKKYTGDRSDWFFEQAMSSNEQLDYVIKKVYRAEDEYILELENKGSLEVPLHIEAYNLLYQKIGDYQFDAFTGKTKLTIPFDANINWIAIDHNMSIVDVNLNDNYIRVKNTKSIRKPTHFNFATSYENPFRKELYYLPGLNGNLYDGPQVGLLLHNYGFLPKKTEWYIMPAISLLSVKPAFHGGISHTHLFKQGKTDKLVFSTTGAAQSYNISSGIALWVFQLSPALKFIFHRRDIYSPLTHEAGVKNQLVVTQVDPKLLLDSRWKFLLQTIAYYKLNYKKRLWEIQNTVSFETTYDFGINYTNAPLTKSTPALKLFNEFKLTYTYYKDAAIQLRLFAGTFLMDPSMVTDTRFRLSGWRGVWDYAFNDYYFGRSETSGFFNQQVGHNDGDFKAMTFIGQTNKWIITANLEWDVPRIYAGAYVDIGTYSGAGSFFGSEPFVYNAGIYLRTPDRALQIYFPFVSSSDITQSIGLNTSTYWERIRFTVQLQNIKFIKNLRKLFI